MGVLLFDSLRYEIALSKSGGDPKWLTLCNRNEHLISASDGHGVKCDWRWSSELHAPKFIPSWGRRLMQKALTHDPIEIGEINAPRSQPDTPDVTFLIGHRGKDRLPLLLLTLKSIANQNGVNCECIVVEESFTKETEQALPAWTKYIHLETETKEQPYNRSRTFNEGAKAARGKLLVFHDNDMLVPNNYVIELLKQFNAGYQVMNLKRFIFYLTKPHTLQIIERGDVSIAAPDFILQNLTGGGSLAVEKTSFFDIGGFDEGFVGWGGEDVEFWDRAQTLKVNNHGYLPIIHLWHAPQPEKNKKKDSKAMRRLNEVMEDDVRERIIRLKSIGNDLSPSEASK